MSIKVCLKEALNNALIASDRNLIKEDIPDDFNLIETLDSMAIVGMLLEAEEKIESINGIYVTLADENLFHANKSPLIKWESWVDYVQKKCEENG